MVVLLLGAAAVHAEEPTSAPAAPGPSAPPVMSTEDAAVADVPKAFLEQVLKVDVGNHITEGRTNKPLTHREVFQRMGRADLLKESDDRVSRRTAFLIIGAGAAVVGAAVGIVLIATGPKLASVECESNITVYNEVCVPAANRHNISGAASIATGVVTGLLFATLAYWQNPDVLDRDATSALLGTYNAQLVKRLREKPSGFKVLPVLTPDGGLLAASLRF
ncbi:MAG: hypothetical protein U0228_33225 [Myxococcaceae bacterium]